MVLVYPRVYVDLQRFVRPLDFFLFQASEGLHFKQDIAVI